jgi:hypothetical protein
MRPAELDIGWIVELAHLLFRRISIASRDKSGRMGIRRRRG